jgi:hypothetical protein
MRNEERLPMTMQWFDIYAPLQEFHWDGDSFELSPGLWVTRFQHTPDLQGWNARLSVDEQDKLFFAEHWLTFRWDEGAEPSPAANVNLVLLALWLVRPTKTHVAFRFQLGPNSTTTGSGRSRLLDRFQWIPGATYDQFDTRDLQLASDYYKVLCDLHCNRGRLNDALVLTLSGCCSRQWQVALICYAAAAETLLTCASGGGVTKRLSIAYACLVETELHRRNSAFKEFRALYSIRSDIMHGRAHSVPANDRLPSLANFADMMRKLWLVVISSSPVIEALEGADAQRKAYIDQISVGYSPPQ